MYEEFLELKKSKLNIDDNLTIEEVRELYVNFLNQYSDNDNFKKLFIWDYELLYCAVNNDFLSDKKYLCPMLTWKDGTKWPDIENFEIERNEFYIVCLENTTNSDMKIRYLNFLIDNNHLKKFKYQYAMMLCNEIINTFSYSIDNFYNLFNKLCRVSDIAVRFKKKDIISKVEKILVHIAKDLRSRENYNFFIRISELLRYIGYNKRQKRITDETIKMMISYLEEAQKYLLDNKKIEDYVEYCNELYEWYREEKCEDIKLKNLQIDIGNAYEKEADYQGGRENKSFLYQAFYLEKAIQQYSNIGVREKIEPLKVKLKNAYTRASNNKEFQEFTTTISIPKKDLDPYINQFIVEDLSTSFERLVYSSFFTLKLDYVKSILENQYEKNSIFYALFSLSRIYNGRKVIQSETEEDSYKYYLCENYSVMLDMYFGIIYKTVWDKLVKKGLTSEMVIDKLIKWPYFAEEDKIFIKQGIISFFNNDYISSMHILVPRFENCFRKFFEYGGYATTSIQDKMVQNETTFNEFLNSKTVKSIIDDDFLFLVKFVMVDKYGYNLRNDIAHGLINIEKFNELNMHIIIYLYFTMTKWTWKVAEK